MWKVLWVYDLERRNQTFLVVSFLEGRTWDFLIWGLCKIKILCQILPCLRLDRLKQYCKIPRHPYCARAIFHLATKCFSGTSFERAFTKKIELHDQWLSIKEKFWIIHNSRKKVFSINFKCGLNHNNFIPENFPICQNKHSFKVSSNRGRINLQWTPWMK